MPKIKVIKAQFPIFPSMKKVAAYARVSVANEHRNAKIEVFIKEIEYMEGLEEFSEECWGLLVDRVVVSREGELTTTIWFFRYAPC